jgi:hypothetical protein
MRVMSCSSFSMPAIRLLASTQVSNRFCAKQKHEQLQCGGWCCCTCSSGC